MCHKVKVLPGRSFRLNPTVCTPYNADFDGDEMNLHIPQNEEAMAEAEILMQVQTQIITPKNGMNVIGCVEDAISGIYLLTKDMKLTKEEAVNLLINSGVDNFIRLKNLKSNLTGKEVFSVLMPNKFEFIGNSRACRRCEKCKKRKCDVNAYVLIKNGELICGIIDSSTIGEGNGTLIRALHREYKEDETLEIMGKIFRLGINTLLKRGFTTGISDTDLPEDVQEKIDRLLKYGAEEVESKINDFKNNSKFEALPGKTKKETLELMILQILNKVRNKIGKIVAENSKEDNPTIIMAKSGAKGNPLNLAQMAACVGQQALRGKRIDKGYNGRTLSIFKKNDLGPEAHGFIKRGFKSGLNPHEFFFGAMTGRDSLMDTALRTPKSGYLYRRLSNALQDLKVEYDFTVRNANKKIIQFSYGEDHIDISKSEGGTINIKKIVKNVVGE
jgi:DNA-directed RNA polymerase subunit A'